MGKTAQFSLNFEGKRQSSKGVGWRGGQSAVEALEFYSEAGFMPWLNHLELCNFGHSLTALCLSFLSSVEGDNIIYSKG